jgi:hypothetical protein
MSFTPGGIAYVNDHVGGPTWARTKDPLIMSQVL